MRKEKNLHVMLIVSAIILIFQIIFPGRVTFANTENYFSIDLINTNLGNIYGIAVDSVGNIYIADTGHNAIKKLDKSGNLTTLVDKGLYNPIGIAVDSKGNLYISDTGNNLIKKLDTSGNLTTINIGGLKDPNEIAIDSVDNLYISDNGNKRIIKFDIDGKVSTLISNLEYGTRVVVDKESNVYFSDTANDEIKKIEISGRITIIASGIDFSNVCAVDDVGNVYFSDFSTEQIKKIDVSGEITKFPFKIKKRSSLTIDNSGNFYITNGNEIKLIDKIGHFENKIISLNYPNGVAVDNLGNVYIADTFNHEIKKIDKNGKVTTVINGDITPVGIAVDKVGNIYISDLMHNEVKKIDTLGNISTIFYDKNTEIYGIAVDNNGNVYAADEWHSQIKKIDIYGNVTTFKGQGLYHPYRIAVDSSENIYIIDYWRNEIKKFDKYGRLTTLVSPGIENECGIAIDSVGNIYLADPINNEIKKIDTNGNQTTLVSGLEKPSEIAIDANGNIYIASEKNNTVKELKKVVGVGDFKSESKETTKATFTWTEAIKATDIIIQQSPAGKDMWTTAVTDSISKDASKATVTGLIPNYEYDFRLMITGGANAGTSNIVKIKTEVLGKPIIVADKTNLTNEDVTVTINYPLEANIKQFKTANGEWENYVSPIVVSENDIISAKYQDLYGNWSEVESLQVENIDKVKPDTNITGNPTSITNSDVILSISKTAGISGVKSITVQKDNEPIIDITDKSIYIAKSNGEYKFMITNGVGVTTVNTINVTMIDKLIDKTLPGIDVPKENVPINIISEPSEQKLEIPRTGTEYSKTEIYILGVVLIITGVGILSYKRKIINKI